MKKLDLRKARYALPIRDLNVMVYEDNGEYVIFKSYINKRNKLIKRPIKRMSNGMYKIVHKGVRILLNARKEYHLSYSKCHPLKSRYNLGDNDPKLVDYTIYRNGEIRRIDNPSMVLQNKNGVYKINTRYVHGPKTYITWKFEGIDKYYNIILDKNLEALWKTDSPKPRIKREMFSAYPRHVENVVQTLLPLTYLERTTTRFLLIDTFMKKGKSPEALIDDDLALRYRLYDTFEEGVIHGKSIKTTLNNSITIKDAVFELNVLDFRDDKLIPYPMSIKMSDILDKKYLCKHI
jgi:hypothetical protein